MIILKDCDLQPGDILFLVSSSNNPLIRFKRALQSFTGKDGKHGHMEVVSVFVCTGGDGRHDSLGYQFHNHERQLRLSAKEFINNQYKQAPEELPFILQSYCARRELPTERVKKELLSSTNPWMQHLGEQIKENDTPEQLLEKMLHAAEQQDELSIKNGIDVEKRRKLIDLLLFCWNVSGHAEILPSVNSSLLVFRPNDPKIRERFLAEYMNQVEVTKAYKAQGKDRTSVWQIFLSLFASSAQDKHDKDQTQKPSEATFCARNIIQVLNKVDPSLVKRGRYVTPKSLEAGMRAATKQATVESPPSIATPEASQALELDDEFEALIAQAEKDNPLPPFKMMILSKSGTELIKDLSQAVEKELLRMKKRWWKNKKDLEKIADLEQQLAPFKAQQFEQYPISMQVEASLAFLHKTLPILQRKTGWFGLWIRATSHANIRAFARTQGIFDGDLRDYAERIKDAPATDTKMILEESSPTLVAEKRLSYLFADWSFSLWSQEKRTLILKQMQQLLIEGHALFVWDGKRRQLIEIKDKKLLAEIINQEDFDNLWSDKIAPITNKQLLTHAKQQNLDVDKVKLLDYSHCNSLAKKEPLTAALLANCAKLFTPEFSPFNLRKTSLAILKVELENAAEDADTLAQLKLIQQQIESEPLAVPKYRSGIDSKAAVAQSTSRKRIFKALDLMALAPSCRYYRTEVYTELSINKDASSPFEYFELQGMHDFNDLQAATYAFHAKHLPDSVIKAKKKACTNSLFLGECPITLTTEWQALPSLSRSEHLLDFAVDGLKQKEIEIHYSMKSGLYFIRQTNPAAERKEITIQMLLEMPKGYTSIPTINTIAPIPHHEDIHKLLLKYYSFTKDKGQLNQGVDAGTINNGVSYINEARRLNVGSCRLRTIAFKEEMAKLYPDIPVAINVNSDHCFIEMELDGQWQRYCLGGYRNVPTLADTMKQKFGACSDETQTSCFSFFAKERPKAAEPAFSQPQAKKA